MWINKNKKIDVLYLLLLFNKNKLFKKQKYYTIYELTKNIYNFSKDSYIEVSKPTIEKTLLDLKSLDMFLIKNKNPNGTLYKIDKKKLLKLFKEEFESTSTYKIIDTYIYNILDFDIF